MTTGTVGLTMELFYALGGYRRSGFWWTVVSAVIGGTALLVFDVYAAEVEILGAAVLGGILAFLIGRLLKRC